MSFSYSSNRTAFEAQKDRIVNEARRKLLDVAKEWKSVTNLRSHRLAIQVHDQVVQSEIELMEFETEKIFAMIEMEADVGPQHDRYHRSNEHLQEQIQTLRDNHDLVLRNIMDKRYSNKIARCRTEEKRNAETRNFARMVRADFDKRVQCAKNLANAGRMRAEIAKKEAEEKQEKARDAKQTYRRVVELQRERRRNFDLHVSKEGHGTASRLAVEMVKSDQIDIDELAKAAKDGKYVWVWIEDKKRNAAAAAAAADSDSIIGLELDRMIPYDQDDSTLIEAHYLVLQAGASPDYVFVEVDTDVVNLLSMKQCNERSGYQRNIRRIAVEDMGGLERQTDIMKLRLTALDDTEKAFSDAMTAFRKAEFEHHKADLLTKQVDDYVYLYVMSRCPSELPDASQAVGHEQIPMSWSHMSDKLYMEVRLSNQDPEYQKVASFFSKTCSKEILSITRIQNVLLWFLFERTRGIVSKSKLNNGKVNEEYLWHGCNVKDGLEKILVGGFDSTLSNYTPKGIWLSTNSQYSASKFCYRYSDGTKKILLVRSVLGYIGKIEGSHSLSTVNGIEVDSHHCGATSVGHVRNDDQVGDGGDNRYVINRSNQVYPAYVLTFHDPRA